MIPDEFLANYVAAQTAVEIHLVARDTVKFTSGSGRSISSASEKARTGCW